MKRLLFFVLVLASFSLVSAKEWIPFESNFEQEPQVNVIESDNNRLVLDINVPGMYLENVTVNGEIFQKIGILKTMLQVKRNLEIIKANAD